MDSSLHSLTDVLKKTLFFFDGLTVPELLPYVQKKMLKDCTPQQVEEKISRCLQQNDCFVSKGHVWTLNLQGKRENDPFYSYLLRKQHPVSIKELARNNSRGKKKARKLLAEEASLLADGRFVQLENGQWVLTEWQVENEKYSLKQLLIKALKSHPGGLSVQQLLDIVGGWKKTDTSAITCTLHKFPYFEQISDSIWVYNPAVHSAYDSFMQRYLKTLARYHQRWQSEKERWQRKVMSLDKQLKEASLAQKEAAAALALRVQEAHRNEHLLSQMAEKDLLLQLRKKEIFRYREHIDYLERKCNSILYQCRLWVKRARQSAEENLHYKEALQRKQQDLEAMFTRLQQYKEKDRENKALLAELKDQHATRVAELQTQVLELRQKLGRQNENIHLTESRWQEEVRELNKELKKVQDERDDLQRSVKFLRQELKKVKDDYKSLKNFFNNPVIRVVLRILSLFGRSTQQSVAS